MSLVVVETEAAPSLYLSRLTDLGTTPVRVTSEDAAAERCANGNADIVVASDSKLARRLAIAFPSVAVVLTAAAQPDAEDMLDLLRTGVADIWLDAQSAEVTEERLAAVKKRASAAGRELRARIAQYESELKRDQRAGRYIQMGMLPPSPMMIDDYRLQQDMLPSHMLSGDFVDYFALADHHFVAYVADVSGHGASSAFVTVLLKNFSRRIRREYHPSMLAEPGRILEWLNRELIDQHMDKHVSMVLLVADYVENRVTLVNAGHYPAAILVSSGKARYVENAGKLVGLFPEVKYDAVVAELAVDDRLVVFSDGVLEMLDDDSHEAREARLLAAAETAEDVRGIWQSLELDDSKAGPDDMTCLMVSREP